MRTGGTGRWNERKVVSQINQSHVIRALKVNSSMLIWTWNQTDNQCSSHSRMWFFYWNVILYWAALEECLEILAVTNAAAWAVLCVCHRAHIIYEIACVLWQTHKTGHTIAFGTAKIFRHSSRAAQWRIKFQ